VLTQEQLATLLASYKTPEQVWWWGREEKQHNMTCKGCRIKARPHYI
jgi:hypothetical protein